MAARPEPDPNITLPDLKIKDKRKLLGPELGTQFDMGQRLFSYFGGGDVFDLAGLR